MEQGSWIRKMFEEGISLKKQYGEENVFDLSFGNPVIDPPDEFFTKLKAIADNPISGMHRYMPNAGLLETREAVARQLTDEAGIPFTFNEIIMTCGAGGALNVPISFFPPFGTFSSLPLSLNVVLGNLPASSKDM